MLTDESKAAFMRAAALLAQAATPAEREVIFRNAESYAEAGKWIPAITAEQFPLLLHPNDPQRQAALADAIDRAQASGALTRPRTGEPQGLWSLQWAAWAGLPPIPVDSPLVHWLPGWVPREAAAPATPPAAKHEPLPWIELAQARARAIITERNAAGLFPSHANIGDQIAREWREKSPLGDKKLILSGATIKRHALKGIGRAE